MSHRLPAFLAMSVIGAFAATPAYAEDAVAEAERNTIIVTGAREQVDTPKAVAPLINTPRSIVTVDREVIKETGAATLVEALRTVPGITFGAAEGGNPIGDRPFIRGFDSQGSVFVDGVRDTAAQSREVFAVEQIQIVRGSDSTLGGRGSAGGSINIVSRLPRPGNAASIDASFGTADYKRVSGDVNIALSPTVGVRVAGVWHDQDIAGRDALFQKRWGVAPSITVGLGTPTRLTLAYYHLTTDELPDSGFPYLYTIGNAPGAGTIYSQPAIGRIVTAGGQSGTIDRTTFFGLAARDFRKTKTDQITFRAEHDFGGVKLRNTARYTHNDQAYIYTQPDDSQGNVFGTTTANTGANLTSGGYVWRRANTRYGYTNVMADQLDLYGQITTGPLKHNFAIGAEIALEKTRRGIFVTRGFVNAAGSELLSTGSTITPRCNATTLARSYCTSLFAPNPYDAHVNYANDTSNVAAPMVRNLAIAETQNESNTQGLYAFDSIGIGDALILNLGVRYDRFHSQVTPGQPIAATGAFTLSRTDELFNWQAGLVVKPTPNTSVYASYATSATPPNSLLGEGLEANALGTTNTPAALALLDALKVERTKSYEIGAKADLFGSRLSLTAAAFQTETKNARVTSDANTVAFVGERRARGVELGFNGRITPWWNVFGGYTYLDAIIVNGGFTALAVPANGAAPAKTVQVLSVNTGRRFPQIAKHSFSAWTNVEPVKDLTIGGGAFYTSRIFGGYSDNRAATQTTAGAVTISPATKLVVRTIPGYLRFDARVGYKFSDQAELAVNIQNLTDKTYFTQAYSSHYASIAPGRSAFATLSLKM